ncbi:Arc family DNA-binding protein [Rhodovulum sp. MB263]|uniref:Arc family DNA-binding protein n=1 Tax=Rhodovulum sp. (strain MB263) TaxID=308754 RepID=UPI0009B788DD|nr:Arc family DNA-binding protein [Rhodovulum sp. MB263]ARC90382.1 hypothetical protein B5V46_00095 [Rhodovulum sp. MB263]
MSDSDSKYPSELAERFQVRLPRGMRDRIKAAAEANNRSMNAEIVAALEEKFPSPLDEGLERLVAFFDRVPKEERDAFIFDMLDRLGVTDQDIQDGLIRGISIREEQVSSDLPDPASPEKCDDDDSR